MICAMCHQDKEDAKLCIDPYYQEINEEEIEVVLCNTCYEERCLEI